MEDWWQRDDLRYEDGYLALSGHPVEQMAAAAKQPLFIYSAKRIEANLRRLTNALHSKSLDFRIFYAMKSNRFEPLLAFIRRLGLCGVDVCSPGELLLARQIGFRLRDVSYTGTSVSNEDLDVACDHPGIWFNCDSLSVIRRLGERCRGMNIGLRVNPGLGLGYRSSKLLEYAGSKPTKFGIYRSQFPEALRLARKYRLNIVGLHFHCGCGYLTPQLPALNRVLAACKWFIDQVPGLRYVNIGGGLGIPLVKDDEPLDMEAWADIVARHLGRTGAQVWIEPGDYIVKDAGVLVLQVNTVEKKEGVVFVGVNGGFNLHIEPAFYKLPLHPVLCRKPRAGRPVKVTIAGNINEALDLFAENVQLPPLKEGDYLAFLNAGGYGTAMSSNHCLRGNFVECLVDVNPKRRVTTKCAKYAKRRD